MKCPTCKGSKEIEIQLNDNGKSSSMKMKCFDCNGTGTVTQEQLQSIEFFKNMWCKCVTPTDSTYHPDTPKMKHHYTCNTCGKVTQIG